MSWLMLVWFFSAPGLKFAFPVAGNGHFHISEAGAQRLAAVAVAAVVRGLVPVVVSAVAQFILQLCLQAVLHELRDGLLEQILDVIHAADVAICSSSRNLLPSRLFLPGCGSFWTSVIPPV